MKSEQLIRIDGQEFEVIDSYTDYRIEDSFIHRSNKLQEFTGNGESKKYVYSYSGENGKKLSQFYEFNNWGKPHKDSSGRKTISSAILNEAVISANCFFTKSNLLKYLETASSEYMLQEQIYHSDIGAQYNSRLNEISELSEEVLPFTIYDASDNWDQKQNRGYIRSDDSIWNLWRKLILPKITYLSISKLRKKTGATDKPYFYFKVFLDYSFREFKHPKSLLEYVAPEAKNLTLKTRNNRPYDQSKWKEKVHEYMPQCPFTKISDERLLVASHIKPSDSCIKEGKIDEATDFHNGLSLSPTYDRLFDRGYITFTDDGDLVCGTEISSYSWGKLNITPSSFAKYNILPKGREKYLSFHRENVFLGNFNELFF